MRSRTPRTVAPPTSRIGYCSRGAQAPSQTPKQQSTQRLNAAGVVTACSNWWPRRATAGRRQWLRPKTGLRPDQGCHGVQNTQSMQRGIGTIQPAEQRSAHHNSLGIQLWLTLSPLLMSSKMAAISWVLLQMTYLVSDT